MFTHKLSGDTVGADKDVSRPATTIEACPGWTACWRNLCVNIMLYILIKHCMHAGTGLACFERTINCGAMITHKMGEPRWRRSDSPLSTRVPACSPPTGYATHGLTAIRADASCAWLPVAVAGTSAPRDACPDGAYDSETLRDESIAHRLHWPAACRDNRRRC